jgi:hypothetical protein
MELLQDVVKVYSGKRYSCMCGCSGKYSYSAEGAKEHGPGYDVSDSVNERSVKIMFNKVMKNPNAQREGNYIFVEEAGRIQVVYFKETDE